MTDVQWIQTALAHAECEAVPYNFMFSPPAEREARDRYGNNIEESLALPLRMTGPASIKPLYADPARYGGTIRDEFGVVWSTSAIDRGSPIGPCLPEPNLSSTRFPEPDAAYRFDGMAEWCARQEGQFRIIWVGDLWERATFMRGMEPLLLDIALNPLFVESLLRQLSDYVLETARILLERFSFEGIAVSDDYGTQKAMLMSPADWRRFVRPCLAPIYELAKRHGRAVFHHSCGNITPIIGDLTDMGLDILHPIQPEAMDILRLKREFGRDLTFCGGIPTQHLLVAGTPDDIRREVRRLKRQMGDGGGYILEPGITIQADVPIANIAAMIDEARRP